MIIEEPLNPFTAEDDKRRIVSAARDLANSRHWPVVKEWLKYQIDLLEFKFWSQNAVRNGMTLDQISDIQSRHSALALAFDLPQHLLAEFAEIVDEEISVLDPYEGGAVDTVEKGAEDPYDR